MRKHHQVRGEQHYCAKLTEKRVQLLRTVMKYDDHTKIEVINIYSKKFKVSALAIRNVLEGKTWKHIK